METPELKPCPFCGGSANIHHVENFEIYLVQCTNCGCIFTTWFPSSDDAKSAWNRRANDDKR